MTTGQVIVCAVFAAIVYGIGFWRGLNEPRVVVREKYQIDKRPPDPPPMNPEDKR